MTDRQHSEVSSSEQVRLEALLKDVTAADAALIDPPADLWNRIEAEAGLAPAPLPMPDHTSGHTTRPPTVFGSPVIERSDAVVVDLDQRRRFGSRAGVLGAVAAVIMLVVGGFVITTRGNDDGSEVVAQAELTFDAARFDALGASATASVSLVEADGMLVVTFDEASLPDPAGESADLELWLIDPDDEGNPWSLVSLGLIDGTQPIEFDVPVGYDPAVYSVVDISVEPRDGNAEHSGRSILRGSLVDA